jgi:hypothetical protein
MEVTSLYLAFDRAREYKYSEGCHRMSPRIIIPRTFGIALVSLLLCAIVASELPELLSLTDNAANDFTMRSADLFVSAVLYRTENLQKAAKEFNNFMPGSLFGRPGTPEKTGFAPSLLFILYSVLRT